MSLTSITAKTVEKKYFRLYYDHKVYKTKLPRGGGGYNQFVPWQQTIIKQIVVDNIKLAVGTSIKLLVQQPRP